MTWNGLTVTVAAMATTSNRQEQVAIISHCKRAGGHQALIQDGDGPWDFNSFGANPHQGPEKVTTAAMFKALNDMEWPHCYSSGNGHHKQ